MWWWTLLVTSALAWGVRTLLNGPVPPGYKSPWRLRIMMLFSKITSIPACIVERLRGPVARILFLRWLVEKILGSSQPRQDGIQITDVQVDGLKVRIYEPEDKKDNSPAVIFYHGGGWTVGSLATSNGVCNAMAENLNAIVVSIEYRLAPEHVFPAAIDDCFVATRHFLTNAKDHGIDPTRVAIAGDSAGGNLVAAVALKLRDEKISPQPKLQVLIYPATQATDLNSPSYLANANDPFLSRNQMVTFWILYAFGHADYLKTALANEHTSPAVKRKFSTSDLDHKVILNTHPDDTYHQPNLNVGDEKVWKKIESIFMNPYFAPLMAEDHSGLPEAIVVTMYQDVLRDDGIWYAKKLRDAGNDVTLIDYKPGFHGIFSIVLTQENYVEVASKIYDLMKEKL